VSRSDEETEDQHMWRVLSEAGLVEIPLEEFAERIKDVKHIVTVRLLELLNFDTDLQERESAAYSLGTLKGLELKLLANAPKPPANALKPPDPSDL
jgi:hypothetical protein